MRNAWMAAGMALAILTLAGCGTASQRSSYASWTQPLPMRSGAVEPLRARDTLRVMSFNLRQPVRADGPNFWDHRREEVAQTIEAFYPDVLGTQECQLTQALFLKERFPGYGFVGAGRDDGGTRGEMCAIFYRLDRFTKLDDGHFWLSTQPYRAGSRSWDSRYPRMASWVKLQEKQTGRTFYAFNTHLDHVGGRARLEGARLLRWQIDAIAGGDPVVITGDFNSAPDEAPYVALVGGLYRGGARLIDTFRQVRHASTARAEPGTRHDFRGGNRGARIDWILTNRGFRTVASGIDRSSIGGRYPSDHYPVTAVVALERPVRTADATGSDRGALPSPFASFR